jgi:hypothetical protein
MAGRLVEFAGWLATQVFDVVGSVAGIQGADGGATVDLQVGKTVHVVPAQMRTELWLSQLHRKTANGGAPSAGEYYDLLFEVGRLEERVASGPDAASIPPPPPPLVEWPASRRQSVVRGAGAVAGGAG